MIYLDLTTALGVCDVPVYFRIVLCLFFFLSVCFNVFLGL